MIRTDEYWRQQEINELTECEILICIEAVNRVYSDKFIKENKNTILIGRHRFNKEQLLSELNNRKNK